MDQGISRMRESYTFDCSVLATIEADKTADLWTMKELFENLFSITAKPSELRFCYDVAHMVSLQSARLYACGIAGIMKKRGLESCHLAIDKLVFNKYPYLPERAIGALGEILEWPADSPDPIELIPAVNRSSVSAALIASLVCNSGGAGVQ